MGHSMHKQVSEFGIEGQFIDFVGDASGKLKYLRIAVEMGEWQIKLSKESRTCVIQVLQSGDWIQVFGKKKLNQQTGQYKLKAYQVNKLTIEEAQTTPQDKDSPSQPKARILVCQKSGCRKRGGQKLRQTIEEVVQDRGLQDKVKIKHTGCMKRCSKAPNAILMPGKTRLSSMKSDAIADLLRNLTET